MGRMLRVAGPGIDASDVIGAQEGAEIFDPALELAEGVVCLTAARCRPLAFGIRHVANNIEGGLLSGVAGKELQYLLDAIQLGNRICRR
jgi:hypothetical protein